MLWGLRTRIGASFLIVQNINGIVNIKVARCSFFKNGNLRFRSVFLENYYLFEDKEYFCYVKQHVKSSNSFTKVAQVPLLWQQ